ncbi:TPA: AAA family ATPase, partial [Aeromonas veronii]
MTPIEKIKGWIEDKPIWWKHTIRLALVNGELDQDDINEIYQIARIEHYLEDEQQFDRSRLDVALDFSGYTTEVDKVNLASIENVQGVGVLHDEQILKFNESGCFIVYGDNGAGKSSYASILKNACLTRGSCPTILGNVFSVNNPTPSA